MKLAVPVLGTGRRSRPTASSYYSTLAFFIQLNWRSRGCFGSESKRMATFRRKRCIIYSFLPLLGAMLLVVGLLPAELLDYGSLASSSIAETFQWGVMVDDEHVMLLKPDDDESRLIKIVYPGIPTSQFGTKSRDVYKKRKLPTKLFKLLNSEVSIDSGINDVSFLDTKIHVHVPSELVGNNSTEDLEGQHFQAIKPVVESTLPKHSRIHVVIITNRRSGSSFLGQFFNQHPGLFFQFEPLKLTEWKKEFYPNRSEFLQHLVKCEFDRTPYLVEFYKKEPLHRASSRVMVNPPLCNLSFSGRISQRTVKVCQQLETVPLMQVCHDKQYHAIKLIRLYSISSLKPLALDPDINLKIIHLVRDPRGIHVSKSKIKGANVSLELGEFLDRDISYLCRRINRNLDFIRSRPSWLRGKYKLVRYEDIAYHPQELADEIYDFTGMGQLPREVFTWIQKNTKGRIKEKQWNSNGMHYTTSRNASQVSEAWRYDVPIQVALRMQEFCRETLRDLGYVEVETEQDLLDKSKSLVTQLPTHIMN